MEPANIDWNRVESRFVRDDLFENFNAPKWVDLSAPSAFRPGDDDAWFCRPGCRHPKTYEDFLPRPPPTPADAKGRNQGANVKRRGAAMTPLLSSPRAKPAVLKKKPREEEDLENRDPNLPPPPSTLLTASGRAAKEAVKSSAERPSRGGVEAAEPPRRLRSTHSARNLFAGREILAQISDFCCEVRRMASLRRGKVVVVDSGGGEGEKVGILQEKQGKKDGILQEKHESKVGFLQEKHDSKVGILQEKHEKKVGILQEKQGKKDGFFQEKQVKKVGILQERHDKKVGILQEKQGAGSLKENWFRSEERLEKGDVKSGECLKLLQQEVRSCPPTPQRFPSPMNLLKQGGVAQPPSRGPPLERSILKELILSKGEDDEIEGERKDEDCSGNVAPVVPKALDMFWFLKPCTYLV